MKDRSDNPSLSLSHWNFYIWLLNHVCNFCHSKQNGTDTINLIAYDYYTNETVCLAGNDLLPKVSQKILFL